MSSSESFTPIACGQFSWTEAVAELAALQSDDIAELPLSAERVDNERKGVRPPRLLVRDFALDINDPTSSELSHDQLRVLHVAIVLEEMFRNRELAAASRDLLRRLHDEVLATSVASLSRRFFRAVTEVESRLAEIDARGRPRRVREDDALSLLLAFAKLQFSVHEHWSDKLGECAHVLGCLNCDGPSKKGWFSAAGIVARILLPARAGDPGKDLVAFTKKIEQAVSRVRSV